MNKKYGTHQVAKQMQWITKIIGRVIVVILLTCGAFATSVSIPLSNGATFNYNVTETSNTCFIHHSTFTFERFAYSSFTYVKSGQTTTFGGEIDLIVNSPATPPCPNNTPGGTVTFVLQENFADFGTGINFTPQTTSPPNDGTASLVNLPTEIAFPLFEVQSIVYAAPGNRSSNGFTNSTTDGVTSSIGQSLQSQDTSTVSVTAGFLGFGSTLSWTSGQSTTTGNSTASTQTITSASGVANATNTNNPSNATNHKQDLFIIWLNPAVKIVQTGTTSGDFSTGTPILPNGQSEVQDQVEVFAQSMLPNAQGNTTVPLSILEQQIIGGETLPGLANICANKSFYPNSCSADPNGQCGCVPSDFTPILALDPLLNFGPTDNPLTADTSGASACANPTSADKCRYVPVPSGPGSPNQETELLEGPQQPGGNIPVNSFTQSDANQTTQTFSESQGQITGYSVSVQGGFGLSFGFRSATQFTWTNSESTGAINGSANSMSVTLSSSTVGCSQDIPIFEDTVFHTFVFQQPSGNSSCP